MNDKDLEEFDKWLKININKNASVSDIGRVFFVTDFAKVWQAACEYKQKYIDKLQWRLDYRSERIKKLKAENAKLKECVEFYADIISWDKCGGERIRIKDDDIYLMNNLPFGGKRARQILEEMEDK